jgi:crotonobetaine/carnitine-CoA ligase
MVAAEWKALEHRTITGLLDAQCEERPDQACLVVRDEVITYAQLRDRTIAAAGALVGLGLQAGETVAIFANTYPSWIYTVPGRRPLGRARRAAQHGVSGEFPVDSVAYERLPDRSGRGRPPRACGGGGERRP